VAVAPTAPKRALFVPEHDDYRESFQKFIAAEVVPNYDEWEKAQLVDRELFKKMAGHGFLALEIPESQGGQGVADWRFNVVLMEEATHSGCGDAIGGPLLHTDICIPYLMASCTDEQKDNWFPSVASGEKILAIAMTEPGTGSDLAGIKTRARRDNGDYVIDGAKTFITNGINADLVITAVRTAPDKHRGLSLMILERGMPGFERGRNLAKVGLHPQDTAELSFSDDRVPAANLLGEENRGFFQLVAKLPQERMSIAVGGVAEARAAFEHTLRYVKERKAFGTTIGSFQNTRFVLAEIATEIDVTQAFIDRCVNDLNAGELSAEDAAKAKWWATELQGRVIDRCVQLHGGYGYMLEYPVARAFTDARVTRIYGGSTEIMKQVIGKSLGL